MSAVVDSSYFKLPSPSKTEWFYATACWLTYIFAMVIYCTLYDVYVHAAAPRMSEAALWGLREWGIWLLLAPIIFSILRRRSVHGDDFKFYLRLGTSCVAFALFYRVGLDRLLQESPSVFVSLVMHTPRYIIGCIGVFLAFLMLRRMGRLSTVGNDVDAPDQRNDARTKQDSNQESVVPASADQDVLLVYQGVDQRLIKIEDIVLAKAARNYVELQCSESSSPYIIRSTLSSLERRLPESLFVRTHRSNIVNIAFLQRIKRMPSGAGKAVMDGVGAVPISKSYMTRLQQFR